MTVFLSPPPQPSLSLSTITDEEMKTGDPKETLRRASILPSQMAEGPPATRRSTLSSAYAGGGVSTRQQRKRTSEESQPGPGTPEVSWLAWQFPAGLAHLLTQCGSEGGSPPLGISVPPFKVF